MAGSRRSVGIVGVGSALPEKVITNGDLEKMVDTSNQWITTRTGIKERRIASPETATSDLALTAGRRAMERAGIEPEELDLILVATTTPDMAFPSTACIVQAGLGAYNAAAFDLEAACSGFLYGLAIGEQFISSGVYETVLIIGAEVLSKIVNWSDRNTCVLFGDGAGACVLRPVTAGKGILSHYLGADGRGVKLLQLPAGGSRLPASAATVEQGLHYIEMQGAEVFKFAVRIMGEASLEALRRAGLAREEVDLLVPHQANHRIIMAAAKRLGLTPEQVIVNLDRYGNMSAASIPVALEEAVSEGRIRDGDNVLLVGFGAGLTWGAAVLKWGL
ncbi:MAG TPA: ketoacyl-ACP synthase III [Firmicutes bacterium]|jgi:3-oxoacyl-[acyl-carrier-protein] synthase-3|nr:ketoacyl-ACP synthase III [Bacillota bacterium]